jgi:hypothetical protein
MIKTADQPCCDVENVDTGGHRTHDLPDRLAVAKPLHQPGRLLETLEGRSIVETYYVVAKPLRARVGGRQPQE